MKCKAMLLLGAIIISVGSCRKKDPPDTATPQPSEATGQAILSFTNVAGNQPLILDSAAYINANGDTFTVSGYAYYISNIALLTSDGGGFTEPESYHLITENADTSRSFSLSDVPAGVYTSVKFLIGVDEARNTSGAQTGALDPMHSMFWDWNTGYIMAKLEGRSPQSTGPAHFIGFHLGGFRGPESVLRWVTLAFPEPVQVTAEKTPVIHIKADMLKWFGPPNIIGFSEVNIIMGPSLASSRIADNYADMFTVSHIHQ